MPQLPNPFHSFHLKHKGPGQFADLDAWEPSPSYAKEEQVGIKAWSGPAPAAIGTKTRTSAPAPMEQIFGDLLKRIWVKAQATTTQPQQHFLAQNRQARPGMPIAQPYRPMVAPTVLNPGIPPPGARPLPAFPAAAKGPMPPRPQILPPPPAARAPPPAAAPVALPNAHLNGVAKDWELHKTLRRYTGYAFRGDHRDPSAIRSAGGFMPSATRNDDAFIKGAVYEQFCHYMQRRFQKDLKSTVTPQQFLDIVRQSTKTSEDSEAFSFYTNWRAIVKSEELHLGRMLAQETLKAYISTTRAVPVAKGFAKRATDANTGAKFLGWVYCVAVNGGFVVPDKGSISWTETFGEAEIAVAGGVPWHAVAAARAVDFTGKFVGDVHVRKGFEKIDAQAFEPIFKLMSGKRQV